MKDMEKFVEWLLEMGYLDPEDIPEDKEQLDKDLQLVKASAPPLYHLLMTISEH